MHVVHEGVKRHAVQPSVCCRLPAKGTSPKNSSTLSVDMLLSDKETLDNEPLDASRDPAGANCSRSSSVSVSMSRERRLYTWTKKCCFQTIRGKQFAQTFELFYESTKV